MTTLKVKKLTPEAVIPSYAKYGDAGLDLTATSAIYDEHTQKLTVGYGIAVEIPEGHVGLLFPRSSIHKTQMTLSNCVGVVDSGYRGEVRSVFYSPNPTLAYRVGDRCAQLIVLPYPKLQIVETDNLSSTERGTGGFGSTGK